MEKVDKNYWRHCLKPPYSPSEDDVEYYKHFIQSGKILVLGCTHALLPISTHQMDFDPWYDGSSVIIRDWRDNTEYFENMVGDGVLNFTKELTEDVVLMAQKCSDRLIVRSFKQKLPNMKVADYFPNRLQFPIIPSIAIEKNHYNFFIWEFKK